jgi:hypothetical protein
MHKDLELSLKTLKDFQDDVPGIGNFPDRYLAKTYDEFVFVLYKDMDAITNLMEENPELLKGSDEKEEDRLTIEIIRMLKLIGGYTVSHDEKIGGHCDFVVKRRCWTWLGEAKIYRDTYSWLYKGFQQLATRYSTGGYNNSQGGLLIYIRVARAKQIMDNWKNYLELYEGQDNIQFSQCPVNPLSFYSEHSHQRTDLPFKVRHIPFCLHFDPQDR